MTGKSSWCFVRIFVGCRLWFHIDWVVESISAKKKIKLMVPWNGGKRTVVVRLRCVVVRTRFDARLAFDSEATFERRNYAWIWPWNSRRTKSKNSYICIWKDENRIGTYLHLRRRQSRIFHQLSNTFIRLINCLQQNQHDRRVWRVVTYLIQCCWKNLELVGIQNGASLFCVLHIAYFSKTR